MDSPNKDRLQGGVDELKGKAKSAFGEATGDDRTKAEGEMDQAKGKIQKGLADAKEGIGNAVDELTGKNN